MDCRCDVGITPLTKDEDGRHGLAGSKTTVALGAKDRERLERLARMRTAQAQTVTRARILLLRDSGETLVSIAEKVGLAVNSVRLCVTKYLEGGVERALSDGTRSGRPREIDDADRAFVAEDSLPDAAQHPGLQQRRARGEDPALPREASAKPVVYRWKWNLSDVDPTTKELVVDTLLPDGADKASWLLEAILVGLLH